MKVLKIVWLNYEYKKPNLHSLNTFLLEKNLSGEHRDKKNESRAVGLLR